MKPFYLAEIIKERCDKEALIEWSKSETPIIPKFEKPQKIKFTAGLFNFIKSNVYQLRP